MFNKLKRLWGQLYSSQRLQIVGVVALMILAAGAEIFSIGMLLPFLGVLFNPEMKEKNSLIEFIYQHFQQSNHGQIVWGITLFFVFAVLFAASIRVMLLWSQIRVASRIGADLSESLYRSILTRPYIFHTNTNSSQVIVGVSRKADSVVNEIILPCMVVVSSAILIVSISIFLALLNPVVAMSAAVGFGSLYFCVMLATRFRIARYGQTINNQQSAIIKVLQEALGSIRDVIIDGAQELYCKAYKKVDAPLRRAHANNLIIGGAPRYLIEGASVALIAFFSCWLSTQEGGIQAIIPTLGVLILGAQKMLPMLQLSYVNFTQIQGSQAALEDVLEILEHPIPRVNQSAVIQFERELLIDHVFYKYKDDADWAVKNVSLKISKGDRIGFVGGTGSGKSTLLDLIMGLLSPMDGKITVDDVVVSEENCRAWQRHIAHVPQSIYLTDASICENIAFGVPINEIDFELVRRAAEKAQIADLIESMKDGYYTEVGERGARLSGGQRQRIGLARALYKNTDLIVLDEATSALDNDTEAAVISAIENLGPSVTILMVAHRLTTLRGCNKIVTVQNGQIQKIGTYADLIRDAED